MIKITIKNKSLLKEAGELKYSQTAFNKIYKIYRENVLQDIAHVSEPVTAPIEEFLFNSNKKLLNGCILFIKLSLDSGNSFANAAELKENWDPINKTFKKEYIDTVLKETQLKIDFNMGPYLEHYGASAGGYATVKNNRVELWLLAANPLPPPGYTKMLPMRTYVDWETKKSIIKHELEHVTQIINSACIEFSKELEAELKQLNNPADIDFMGITRVNLRTSNIFFAGSGKTKTKKRGVLTKDYYAYLLNNEEYKPYLTNIIDDLLNAFFKEKLFTKNNLALAKIKELPVKERLKYIKNRVKENPQLFDKEMFVQMLANARSFEDLAKVFLQPIIQNKDPIIYSFNIKYGDIIKFYIRNKKEFPNDLYIGMVKRLRQIADKMVIKYYNDKDSN